MVVLIGIVVVYLLWRLLSVQHHRAQVEVAKVVIDTMTTTAKDFEQRRGTQEQAARDGRLIEYSEDLIRALGIPDENVRLAASRHDPSRRALAIESVQRGKPCKLLGAADYTALRAHYPGPDPRGDLTCSAFCDETSELTYMPRDATACPFCGAATTVLDIGEKALRTWDEDNAAWQIWKKCAPSEAATEEQEWRATTDRDRAEFDAALAAFRARRA